MTHHDIIERLLRPGVIAIMRADSSAQMLDAARAIADGGITAMEVTMTTPGALEVIRDVVAELGARVAMGAGSVLDDVTARLAILAGAQFIVTPVLRTDVIAICRRYGKPVIVGACTPTEALAAQEAGADFVKLFPAETMGLKYIKALLAPLPQLRVIPTGGVDSANCGDFLRAGCVAVAASGSLAGREILQKRDWAGLTQSSKRFVEAARAARAEIESRPTPHIVVS